MCVLLVCMRVALKDPKIDPILNGSYFLANLLDAAFTYYHFKWESPNFYPTPTLWLKRRYYIL